LVHFPLMFVIGSVFTRDDVIKIGKVTLWIAIPMLVLIALQFYSPQSSFVNRGVGGDLEGAGFSGAMGFFRPSGTFSFTNGNAMFFSFVAPFVIYFWLDNNKLNKIILYLATIALLFAIPVSISRALFFQVIISLAFLFLAIGRKPEYMGRLLLAVVGGIAALALLNQTSSFSTATEVFTSRFETASSHEGGLEGVFMDRILGGLIEAITGTDHLPFWGFGVGMGTNVGSMLLTGSTTFLISEAEWGRLTGELGPLMGIIVILIRTALVIKLSLHSYLKIIKGDLLPWMLLSVGFALLLQAQWAQPTALGFSTIIGGLMIASLKTSSQNNYSKY
jgi:hypothetical protein